jgi:hypothetical protein
MFPILVFSAISYSALPDVQNIVATARASRDAISTYHIVALLQSKYAQRDGDVSSLVQIEVWRDGDKQRTDHTIFDTNSTQNAIIERRLYCRNCERSGYALSTTVLPKQKGIMGVKFTKITPEFDKTDDSRMDWARLGMLNKGLSGYLQNPPDHLLLFMSKHPSLKLEEKTYDKANTYVLTVSANTGYTSCYLRPDLGMNPVYFVTGSSKSGLSSKTTIDYQQVSGQWYPKHIVYAVGEGALESVREEITLKTVELNTPIDPTVFTLAGFGLKNGTPIEYPEIKSRDAQPIWNNGQIDPNENRGQAVQRAYEVLDKMAPQPDVQPTSENWSIVKISLGIAAGLVGLVCTYFYFRRKAARAT